MKMARPAAWWSPISDFTSSGSPGIEPARTKSFEDVKAQIEGELRQQAAEKRFSEIAEQFSNSSTSRPMD